MSTTVSHFANFINMTYGGQAIGSTENLQIEQNLTRVEGDNNAVISGPTSSHITGRHFKWSVDSFDVSALVFLRLPANQKAQNILTGVWVASETQPGTPLGNQTVSVVQCVIDRINEQPNTKKRGMFKIEGHCMATSDDSPQYTVTPLTSMKFSTKFGEIEKPDAEEPQVETEKPAVTA